MVGGELEVRLQDWICGAAAAEKHERLLLAGELLARCVTQRSTAGAGLAGPGHGGSGDSSSHAVSPHSRSSRADRAVALLADAVREAELSGQPQEHICTCIARSL